MSRVLVVSPHPDDESVGCGGAIRARVVEGDAVHVIYLTSGERGGHGRSAKETASLREEEATEACTILGVECVEFYREPDGGVKATRAVVERLSAKIRDWNPECLYVPHDREMHPDHRASARLVRGVLSKLGGTGSRTLVLMYEVWTPIQRIDHIVDISAHIETKLAAIRAHKSQCAVMAFDEAILGLNRYRGEMHSWPGGNYAEVFAELRP
jgi:N-acetylglucosamine malate deacetylase 1